MIGEEARSVRGGGDETLRVCPATQREGERR